MITVCTSIVRCETESVQNYRTCQWNDAELGGGRAEVSKSDTRGDAGILDVNDGHSLTQPVALYPERPASCVILTASLIIIQCHRLVITG